MVIRLSNLSSNESMKKFLFIFIASFLLAGCMHNKKPPAQVIAPRKTIEELVNTIPLEDRVYATLSIKHDGSRPVGRELVLSIADSKGASTIEYDVEVQAGTTIQGGGGEIDPKKEKAPFIKDIFLGTCSAGGACSYYKDVKGGMFVVRFKGSPVGSLKGEWSFAEPGNDGKFSSRDAKFQVNAPKLKSSFVLISQALGLPKPVEGEIIAGPYHLDVTATVTGDMELSMRLTEEVETATLWRWDGKKYQKISVVVSAKTLTATIAEFGTYLVTK